MRRFAVCGLWLAVCGLLLVPVSLFAEEEFVYNSRGQRDPLIPLITEKTRVGVGLMGIESIDDVALEGIVWDADGGSLAILNGIILKENEEVGNVRITKIESNKIKLIINDEEYTIQLVKENGEE